MRFNSHKNIFSTFVSAQRERKIAQIAIEGMAYREELDIFISTIFSAFSFVCCTAQYTTEENLLCSYALVKWCRLNTFSSHTKKHFQFLQFNDKVKCIVSAIKNRRRTKKKFYFMDISVFSISLHLVIIIILYHPKNLSGTSQQRIKLTEIEI